MFFPLVLHTGKLETRDECIRIDEDGAGSVLAIWPRDHRLAFDELSDDLRRRLLADLPPCAGPFVLIQEIADCEYYRERRMLAACPPP